MIKTKEFYYKTGEFNQMNQPTLQERQRQMRTDAILDAAHEMMVAQSYADMSMDDLAARVGVSKATLYQHFPSKEDLAINVIVRSMRLGEESIRAIDPRLPAIQRLEQAMREAFERRIGMWSAKLALMPSSVMRHPNYEAQATRMRAAMAELVDQAKAEGDIVTDLPTNIIVRTMGSLFRVEYDDLLATGQCSVPEISQALVAILFNGLRPRHSSVVLPGG